MRVSISAGGKFHAFQLAEQMARRGCLEQLITTYFSSRRNARGMDIPPERVWSNLFPEAVARIPNRIPWVRQAPWAYFKGEMFDRWASRQLQPCDALVAWSGFSLQTMRRARELGALTVLVRSSAHIVVQKQLLEEELRLFGHREVLVDPRTVEKELQEYEECDFITVPSRFVLRTFVEQGVAESKLLLWPLGVDTSRFHPPEAAPSSGRFHVLYVGQINLRKGVHYLLDGFRRAALADAELLLVGSVAPHFARFMRDLPPAVRHLGIVRFPRLQEVYRRAAVFVMPAVEDGFPLVVLEAMASGLPVIVSANAGTADAVEPGVSGYVVPARDPDAVAECLVRLHADPELRLRMGRAARQCALEFTWDRFGATVAAGLESLCADQVRAEVRRTVVARPPVRPGPPGFKVSVSSGGKFHAFHLAEQMARRGWLEQLITTYFSPRRNARGMDIPLERVRSNVFPEVVARVPNRIPWLRQAPWVYLKGEMFDHWASRQLEPCDALVAWSGFSLKTMRRARELGALTILVRGSAHIVVQKQLLEDELCAFGQREVLVDPRTVGKELREYEEADLIAVNSRFTQRSFLEQGIAESKLLVWPLGVDVTRFHPAEAPPPPGRFRILFVGAMSFRKGVPYLLEAFRRIALPEAELLLVGATYSHFASFMRRLPPGARYVGSVRSPLLQELYRNSTVFVLPSVEDGFGQVVLQAMASGLPVIVSRNAGAADTVEPGVSGFVVPPRDPYALAECLVRLYEDRELLLGMGREARQRALKFTWDNYGAAVESSLKSVLAGRASA